MENRILEICQNLCCDKIFPDEQLIVSGLLDSFKIMELICHLENEFHIEFLQEDISDIDNFSCVNHMVAIVSKKIERIKD